MHMVEKILNNTTPYGKIRASHEGSLHSSTLKHNKDFLLYTGDHIIDNTLLSDPLNSMIAINKYALTKINHASKHYPIIIIIISTRCIPLSYILLSHIQWS